MEAFDRRCRRSGNGISTASDSWVFPPESVLRTRSALCRTGDPRPCCRRFIHRLELPPGIAAFAWPTVADMERTSPDLPPHGSARPRSPQSTARDRLGPLPRGPARYWSPAASGPMPVSEALAARRYADRPWWRKAAERVPVALRGRWGLSVTAVGALGLVAAGGAAVGGWYLTRSQGTVVEVGAGEG